MKTVHYHWIVQAYVPTDQPGHLFDVSNILLQADSEEEAFKKAASIVARPAYRTAQVRECFDDHDGMKRLLEAQVTALRNHGGGWGNSEDDPPFPHPRFGRL